MFDPTAQDLSMASRRPMILAVIPIVFIVLLLTVWIGARRQQRALAAEIDRLRRGATLHTAKQSVTPHFDNLPAPVGRYLRLAVPSMKPIQEVRIKQTG